MISTGTGSPDDIPPLPPYGLTSKGAGCRCVQASRFLPCVADTNHQQIMFADGRLIMTVHESTEDYLKQILMLLEKKGHARSVDIAIGRNVSKPTVSITMKKLRENGYIRMSADNFISLTDKGYAIARKTYDRHQALTKYLIRLGVPEKIAQEDACRIEHDLSEESFDAICRNMIQDETGSRGEQPGNR